MNKIEIPGKPIEILKKKITLVSRKLLQLIHSEAYFL